jgi:hypothetical protein
MENGYHNDIYGSGDFNHIKNKVHCSVYHDEGHTMNRHKGQRARGIAGRNHRLGTTEIIEVTRTNSLIFFHWYVLI